MYYDDFDPSDGLWYEIQEMLKDVERIKEPSELSRTLGNLSNSEKNEMKEFFQRLYRHLSGVRVPRNVSSRVSALADRRSDAESKLRKLVNLF